MNMYIVLIADRYDSCGNRHYIKCESLERARVVAKNYREVPNNKFMVDIYELGKSVY